MFRLADVKTFEVLFSPFSRSVVEALKTVPSRIYDAERKMWSFSIEDLNVVERALQAVDDVELVLEKIPDHAVKTLQKYSKEMNSRKEPVLDDHIENIYDHSNILQQLDTFLPGVSDVILIEKGNDLLPEKKTNRTVVIMSYDLMVSKRASIIEYDFRAVIFDESHLLKDGQAQRTKAATDIS
ncbi:unnamed protein product, partial [Gongylonema pulchrum]|uniref:HARP domain-containing protein n=1 Tax=Gongylonema pulchrum TaxID=637853 RepID=A0A183D8I8_9BILA